jgi:hypothetical protein
LGIASNRYPTATGIILAQTVLICIARGLLHYYTSNSSSAGFQVPTAVVMNSSTFWDLRPCGLSKINGNFGGKCRLHLRGSKNKPNKKPA